MSLMNPSHKRALHRAYTELRRDNYTMLTKALTEKMTRLRDLPNLPRWCLLGWVLGLASQANIVLRLDDFALKLLMMQLAPDYEVFQGSLSTWTASDIAHYYEHLGFDLIHPIIYSVAISLNLAWSFRAAGVSSRHNLWLAAPLLAGLLDEIENYAHYTAVTLCQPETDSLIDFPMWTFTVGSTAAKLKWSIVLASFATILILALCSLRRRVKSTP